MCSNMNISFFTTDVENGDVQIVGYTKMMDNVRIEKVYIFTL